MSEVLNFKVKMVKDGSKDDPFRMVGLQRNQQKLDSGCGTVIF